MNSKEEHRLLRILRYPHEFKEDEVRQARLSAANLIEELQQDYINLKDWAKSKGLDVTTYG